VTGQKHLAACEDHSNTYKIIQRWRWYPQTIHIISKWRQHCTLWVYLLLCGTRCTWH